VRLETRLETKLETKFETTTLARNATGFNKSIRALYPTRKRRRDIRA